MLIIRAALPFIMNTECEVNLKQWWFYVNYIFLLFSSLQLLHHHLLDQLNSPILTVRQLLLPGNHQRMTEEQRSRSIFWKLRKQQEHLGLEWQLWAQSVHHMMLRNSRTNRSMCSVSRQWIPLVSQNLWYQTKSSWLLHMVSYQQSHKFILKLYCI